MNFINDSTTEGSERLSWDKSKTTAVLPGIYWKKFMKFWKQFMKIIQVLLKEELGDLLFQIALHTQ